MTNFIKSCYISNSFDPTVNLSLEEYLLDHCKENETILYLWQNNKTVVIGKNQNPYKECKIDLIKKDGVTLVRRLSGGGAVYHDKGNLNFTFISHKRSFNVKKQLDVILDSLKVFGISGEISGRNDLTYLGKKFSGNAFMNRQDYKCHHGTILVNSKLKNMVRYLTPPEIKITSKGIKSIRSRVLNLHKYNKSLTCSSLIDILFNTFDKTYTGTTSRVEFPTNINDLIEVYRTKYQCWEWNFSHSPKCSISFNSKFSWGNFGLDMDVQNGIITKCFINTDALNVDLFDGLDTILINSEAKYELVSKKINLHIKDIGISNDLSGVLKGIFV